jgi:hypothetical protein
MNKRSPPGLCFHRMKASVSKRRNPAGSFLILREGILSTVIGVETSANSLAGLVCRLSSFPCVSLFVVCAVVCTGFDVNTHVSYMYMYMYSNVSLTTTTPLPHVQRVDLATRAAW